MKKTTFWTGLLAVALLLAAHGVVQAAEPERQPEPPVGKQDSAMKLIKEVYKEEYLKRGPEERLNLGKKMVEDAKTTREPATQYMLLKEARDIGIQLMDLDLSMSASEWMGKLFTVSGVDLKLKALTVIRPQLKTPEANNAGADVAQALVDQAIAAEEFRVAIDALEQLKAFALGAKNIQLASSVESKKDALSVQQTAYNDFRNGQEKLKSDPGNAPAKYQVGSYLCMYRMDWDKGLALTVAGSDGSWTTASRADTAAPVTVNEMMKVADLWYDLGSARPAFRGRIWMRAEFWYNILLPMTEGVQRTKVEKRLDEIAKVKPIMQGNITEDTKKVLPTEADFKKLKELSQAVRSGGKKARDEAQRFAQSLTDKLKDGLMSGKETDFFARCKAELAIRKTMEDNGASKLNSSYTYLTNSFVPYAAGARTKDDFVTRLIAFERFNSETKSIDPKVLDTMVSNSITQFVINNQSQYIDKKVRLELCAFLKDHGVQSKGVDQYKAIVEKGGGGFKTSG